MKKRDFLKGMLGIAGASILPGTIDKALGNEKEFLSPETVEKAVWHSSTEGDVYIWNGDNWETKKAQLPDDAVAVYKLVRSPERRVFYVDVG